MLYPVRTRISHHLVPVLMHPDRLIPLVFHPSNSTASERENLKLCPCHGCGKYHGSDRGKDYQKDRWYGLAYPRRTGDGSIVQPVAQQHLTAESTYQIKEQCLFTRLYHCRSGSGYSGMQSEADRYHQCARCGRLINPALAQAQVHGGMSMGIGYGMSEYLQFDEKTGRTLNDNLLDYKLSTCMDHPHLEGGICGKIMNPPVSMELKRWGELRSVL